MLDGIPEQKKDRKQKRTFREVSLKTSAYISLATPSAWKAPKHNVLIIKGIRVNGYWVDYLQSLPRDAASWEDNSEIAIKI